MTLGRRITGVAVLAALCVVAPMTAHAGLTGTRLPFHGFSDMEVDGATGHLLLTGGRAMAHVGSYLAVMDAAGTFLGKVDGTGGAAELAIDEASRVVYVARPDHHAIAVVNLDTLTVVDSFRTPSASPGPRSLALIGTRLWFGFGD